MNIWKVLRIYNKYWRIAIDVYFPLKCSLTTPQPHSLKDTGRVSFFKLLGSSMFSGVSDGETEIWNFFSVIKCKFLLCKGMWHSNSYSFKRRVHRLVRHRLLQHNQYQDQVKIWNFLFFSFITTTVKIFDMYNSLKELKIYLKYLQTSIIRTSPCVNKYSLRVKENF